MNTDGIIVFFKRENYDKILTLCDDFENTYNFKIDTRTEIESGFFFGANKKVYINDKGNSVIKGFSTGFSFNYFPDFLVSFLKNHKKFLINFINNEESEKQLYNNLWNTFLSQFQSIEQNQNIKSLVKNETIDKTKVMLFFSSNPDFVAGFPGKIRRTLGGYPVSIVNFKKKYTREEIITFVLENKDTSAYWLFLLRQLSNLYLFNIKNNKTKEYVLPLGDIEQNILKNSPSGYFHFFVKERKLLKVFCFLLNEGFIIFLKNRDKRSFPRKHMIQTNLGKLKNEHQEKFSRFLFENYYYGVMNAYSITVHLKDSWFNKICCLDFDDIEWFFEAHHFNEKKNEQQKHFIKFLLEIKENGFLIFSSMTNTPFDRFKVFFKIDNIPTNFLYKDFQKLTKNDIKNYNFNTEENASIFGDGNLGQKLIIPNNFKNLMVVNFESYKNFFVNNQKNIFTENKKYDNKTYESLLIDLFDERNNDQRDLYNNLLINQKEVNLFKYQNYNIDKSTFIKIFINVIKKNNYNFLDVSNEKEMLNFYNFSFDTFILNKSETINQKITPNKKSLKKIKEINQIANKKHVILYPKNNYLKALDRARKAKLEVNENTLDDIIVILTEFMSYINKQYGTNFSYSEQTKESFVFHSNCIYKPEDGNPQVVTAYINHNFQCNINCYHDSCKHNFAYRHIQHSINQNFYSLTIHTRADHFEDTYKDFKTLLGLESIQ